MTINMDVVIDTPENSVDMKTGLTSLQGLSDATRCIAETILTERVPERQHHKSKVRTTLKQTFTGSYGHVFSLDIYDPDLLGKFGEIGPEVMAELIGYFLDESLYKDTRALSSNASDRLAIIQKNNNLIDSLISQLRKSALKNIHDVTLKFEHDLKLRYRPRWGEEKIISTFNESTARTLEAFETQELIDLEVNITRLNINTGNGRLLVKGNTETVAFGFASGYKSIRYEAKKVFSVNLDSNNGLDEKHWKFIKIQASPIRLQDGTIIKYLVKAIYNE